MANRNRLQSAISTILIIALLLSLAGVLSGAGRTPPENPISSDPEKLYPETMSGRGSLQGSEGEDEGDETSNGTNTPEPSEPPEETPEPDETPEPTATPTPTATPETTPCTLLKS